MAYIKQEWKDEILNGPEQYNITAPGTNINGAEITLSTPITQAGTPVTAERMNHIEEGIANNREFSMRCLTENYYQTDEKNIDEITDSFCLISEAVTNSGPLFALLQDQSRHAYLENKFFEVKSTTGKREQIATGYYDGTKASRIYRWNNTWSEWKLFYRAANFDTGWIDMPMLNGWSAHPNYWFRYRKINNIVWYQGIITANGSTNRIFCRFPEGFRPAMRIVTVGAVNDISLIMGYVANSGIMNFLSDSYGSHISISGQFAVDR